MSENTLGWIEQARTSIPINISLTINFHELYLALIACNHMRVESRTFEVNIPGNSTTTITLPVGENRYLLVEELHLVPDTDDALSIKILPDGRERDVDTSLNQQTYPIPVKWFEVGVEPIENELKIQAENTTINTVNLKVKIRYTKIDKTVYNRSIRKYLSAILQTLLYEFEYAGIR